MTKSHHVMVKPHHIMVKPHHIMMRRHHIMVKPHHIMAKPHHVMVKLHHIMMKPHHITIKAYHVIMKPHHIITNDHIRKLWLYIQNAAARLVAGTKKQKHVTPVLQTLHWLPIRARIDFKILLITYEALNNKASDYIFEILAKYKPTHKLRSADKNC